MDESGQSFRRTLDEFEDMDFCKMTAMQRERFLSAIAERGAFTALKHVGLHDENAGDDVRDLRSLISGFRVIKKTAWSAFWQKIINVIVTILTILLVGWLFGSNPHTKEVIKTIVAP